MSNVITMPQSQSVDPAPNEAATPQAPGENQQQVMTQETDKALASIIGQERTSGQQAAPPPLEIETTLAKLMQAETDAAEKTNALIQSQRQEAIDARAKEEAAEQAKAQAYQQGQEQIKADIEAKHDAWVQEQAQAQARFQEQADAQAREQADIARQEAAYVVPPENDDWNASLNHHQMETLSVLTQYRGYLPIYRDQIQSKIDDPNLPFAYRKVLSELNADPTLYHMLDVADTKKHHADGGIAPNDLDNLWNRREGNFRQFSPDLRRYNPPPAAPLAPGQTAPEPACSYVIPPYNSSPHPPLTEDQKEVIAVLNRYRSMFPIPLFDLPKKIDDPKTPPDLKQALKNLRADPTLNHLLDCAGAKGNRTDGVMGAGDLDTVADWPEMKSYNARKAESYTHAYVPSDSKDPAALPREITANDAMREMYLYSETLPKKIDTGTLQSIVEGTSKGQMKPPQLIAAAEYFLQNPKEWDQLTAGEDGKADPGHAVTNGHLLDNIAKNIYLTDDESKAMDMINDNRDVFFKDKLFTRADLQQIANDPDGKPDAKRAARQLLDDPLLFGMIDNGTKGHAASKKTHVDDAKVSAQDFDTFKAHLTTINRTPPPLPPGKAPETDQAKRAYLEMQIGVGQDPEVKHEKGGDAALKGFMTFLHKVASPCLMVYGQFMHAVSMGLSVLSKIPIIGEIAAPLSMLAEAVGGACDIVNSALKGENIAEAARKAAMGMAGAAIGQFLVPGAGAAILKGATAVATKIAERAAGTAMVVAENGVASAAKVAEQGVAGVATRAADAVSANAKGIAENLAGSITRESVEAAAREQGVGLAMAGAGAGAFALAAKASERAAMPAAVRTTAGQAGEKAAENAGRLEREAKEVAETLAKKEARDEAKKESRDARDRDDAVAKDKTRDGDRKKENASNKKDEDDRKKKKEKEDEDRELDLDQTRHQLPPPSLINPMDISLLMAMQRQLQNDATSAGEKRPEHAERPGAPAPIIRRA